MYFKRGRVIHASVLNQPDRLGELLVRNGVIDRSHLSEAMEAQAHRKGVRIGDILVENGVLSEEELRKYISPPDRGGRLQPLHLGPGVVPLRPRPEAG